MHIFACSSVSVSSMYSCFKRATSFIQPLNTHLKIYYIRHSVVSHNNELLPKSSLNLNHRFVVLGIRPHIKSSMLSCLNHDGYWNGVNKRSQEDCIHPSTPTTARVQPSPNRLVRSAAPCSSNKCLWPFTKSPWQLLCSPASLLHWESE